MSDSNDTTLQERPIPGSFMRMSDAPPPCHDEVLKHFNINTASTIFTFGDVIHNPAGAEVSEDFVKHEECHAEQQGHTPEGAGRWWARYFQDQYFRTDQEARAFAAQYDWWCKNGPPRVRNNREQRFHYLRGLAFRLAAPTYGAVVNERGAVALIKQHIKTK